jgi:hypothetical protein
MRDVFFHGFYGFIAVVLPAPDNTLESVQQFFNSQANTEQYAITGPIFQTFWLIIMMEIPNRLAASRHLFPPSN